MALATLRNILTAVTKSEINEQLSNIFSPIEQNLLNSETVALKNLQKMGTKITIKPADKILGSDYIRQCLEILQDSEVYRRVETYPTNTIENEVYTAVA